MQSYVGQTLACENFEDGKRFSGTVVDENPEKVFVKITPNRTWPVLRSRITGTTWVNDAADYPKVGDDPSFDRVARGIKKPRGASPGGGQAAQSGDGDAGTSAAAPTPAPGTAAPGTAAPGTAAPGTAAPGAAPNAPPPDAVAHAEASAATRGEVEASDDALVDEELHVDARPARPASSTAAGADPWDPYLSTGGRRPGTELPAVAREGLDPDALLLEPLVKTAAAQAPPAPEEAAGDFTPPQGYVRAQVKCRGALRVSGYTVGGRKRDIWPSGMQGYFSAATVKQVPDAFDLTRAHDKALVQQIDVPKVGAVAHVRAKIAIPRGAVRVNGYEVSTLAPRGQWRAGEVGLFPKADVDNDPKTFTLA